MRVGDGARLPVKGVGSVRVTGKDGQVLTLTNVHWVPAMHSRLMSVSHLTSRGAQVSFTDTNCVVSKGGRIIMQGEQTTQGYTGLFKVVLLPAE